VQLFLIPADYVHVAMFLHSKLRNVRVWNFVSGIKGGTCTEGVGGQGAEENTRTKEE
jgi:hypothetical protein